MDLPQHSQRTRLDRSDGSEKNHETGTPHDESPLRPAGEPPPVTDSLADIVTATRDYVEDRAALTWLRFTQRARATTVGAGLLLVGALLTLLGTIWVGAGASMGLSNVMPRWAAWTVVGGIFLLLATLTGVSGYLALPASEETLQ